MLKHSNIYLAIIDAGTGSIRLTVFDLHGKVMEERQIENKFSYPEPGYVEQNTGNWWIDIQGLFQQIPSNVRNNIGALSVTGQREGIVPVNNKFEPLANLISWMDTRTSTQASRVLRELGQEMIYAETGLIHNPAWSLSKILWIRENQPEIYQSSFKLLQAVDYLISRISGTASTDVSMASRTCLLNVTARKWSKEIISRFGIDEEKLPALYEPGEEIGQILPGVADQFGLQKTVKIYAGSGDQQAAAIGVGAFEEGVVSIGIGTASSLSITIPKPSHINDGKIILNCAAIPGKWEYEPPIWNTGSLIKWYYEQIEKEVRSYKIMLDEVDLIQPGGSGLIALPYFTGAGSPRWNPKLSGGFYGVTLNHKRIHFLRAIMESIAFEIKLNLEAIERSGVSIQRLVLSGGASRNLVLGQIISDVVQKPVDIFKETEASSWGQYCLVRSKLNSDEALEDGYKSLGLSFHNIVPDVEKRTIYEEFYNKYVEFGEKISTLTF